MNKYLKILSITALLFISSSCHNDDDPLLVTFDQIQGQWEVEQGNYEGSVFYLYPDSTFFLSTQFKNDKEHGHKTLQGKATINNTSIHLFKDRDETIIQVTAYSNDDAVVSLSGLLQAKDVRAFRKNRKLDALTIP